MKTIIIAECGHNGNGNIRMNLEMIREARECGADIVKFQLYDIDTIKLPWQSRYMELRAAQLTQEDLYLLKEEAEQLDIEFMCSVFSPDRVEWLEEIGVERYKLGSRSIYDYETIKAVEKTKKPIIASLGKWKEEGFPHIKNASYLYCISDYPAKINRDDFPIKFNENGYSGFSDHTIGTGWAKEAMRRGALYVEKHFTLSRQLPGYNQAGSVEPYELKELVAFAKQMEEQIA